MRSSPWRNRVCGLAGSALLILARADALAQDTLARPTDPRHVADLQVLVSRWWQWRVALPELATPAKDPAGRFCDVGQPSDVWFLAGYLSTGSGAGPESASVRRSCTIAAGRRVFVPIVTKINFPRTEATPLGCERVRANAEAAVDTVSTLVAELDERPLPDLDRHRVATQECFALFAAIKARETGFPAAADGYWLLLDPLPKGHHTLRFGARFAAGGPDAGQFQDTTYDLDVR